jgi:creatinine amidohydrolase/Fe(II)-dependent formamide hydrolase-like protein
VVINLSIIPFGSFEYHGPHLPCETDSILANEFARKAAAQLSSDLNVRAYPTFPVGASDEHLWHSSTLSVDPATLTAMVVSLCEKSFVSHGERRFMLLNCHGGNRSALEVAAQVLTYRGALLCTVVNPLALVGPLEGCAGADIHGGVLETSLMLALSPDSVKDVGDISTRWSPADPGDIRLARKGVFWPWSSDAFGGVAGVIGDPGPASTEQGEMATDRAVAGLVELGNEMRKLHA